MSGFYQFRGYPWPHSSEGYGGPIEVEYYPFQGLDLSSAHVEYDYEWLILARVHANLRRERRLSIPALAAGTAKNPGYSPFGTPLAQIARTGGDILSAPCGYCGQVTSRCGGKCGQTGEASA